MLRTILSARWLALIIISTLIAATTGFWVGIQSETEYTATTHVYARRVGFSNRPLPDLDDHVAELIDAVEFPAVFLDIEQRTLLQADRDYEFNLSESETSDSVIEINVVSPTPGDAERINRILSESIVDFVLQRQERALETRIEGLEGSISDLLDDQDRLAQSSAGASPITLQAQAEASLIEIGTDTGPASGAEAIVLDLLDTVRPIAEDYAQNLDALADLRQETADARIELAEVESTRDNINSEEYRSITPVTDASKVPVAIALAFAAAIPAAVVSIGLVTMSGLRRSRITARKQAQNLAV